MKKVLLTAIIILTATCIYAQAEETKEKVMKPALIVIDIQNQYKDFIPDAERELGIVWMNASIWLFRQHGYPIIRVYHTDPEWGEPVPGTEQFEFWEEVIIDSTDTKVVKNYPSSFKKTDLEKILKEKGINTIFLTGLSAVGCVLATYHSGQYLDYNTFLVKDAIMSHNTKFTDVIEEAYNAIGWDTMKFMMEHMRK